LDRQTRGARAGGDDGATEVQLAVADLDDIGFPLAEIRDDGSSVITKHPNTGGQVSIGTITAQLLYEIAGARYANPDATARFDTIELSDDGPDRVRSSGVRGEPPPAESPPAGGEPTATPPPPPATSPSEIRAFYAIDWANSVYSTLGMSGFLPLLLPMPDTGPRA
jgi:hypothetical protein